MVPDQHGDYDLHSSMERLKALHELLDMHRAHRFTFQYGEIKRLWGCHPRRKALSFTFQYGEIKSIDVLYIIKRDKEIYIPVWRD